MTLVEPQTPEDLPELRERLTVAVRRVCPAWMADHHDDLVQMSLMRLLRSELTGELSSAYLHRVAHSVVVDEIRRKKRRNEVGLTPSLPERLRNEGVDPEATARGIQLGDAIVDCLGLLTDDRRRAVTLHLQGHTVPEISELLGFDRKRAENLVYRGLQDLRAALTERGLRP